MKVSRVCRILGYSRQAYYSSRKGKCSTVHPELYACILNRRVELPGEGIRKLYEYLKCNSEHYISRSRLEGLLVDYELRISRPKRYRVLTNSNHNHGFSGNYLKDRKVEKIFEVLVSDLTYLKTREREYYLIAIMDLYSRLLLSYLLSEDLGTEGLLKAFKSITKEYENNLNGCIFHSDRGNQFCSNAFKELAARYGIILSNSRSGNPYDNACMERLFATLKSEYKLNVVFPDKRSLSDALRDAVYSYNNRRLHMSLGLKTPKQKFMESLQSY